jgi:hypothetical protein
MVEPNQIPHADDSALADLVGEARNADETLDYDALRIREESVKFALQVRGEQPGIEPLIATAARIEAYILKGYEKPEKDDPAAPAVGGARAFVEDETGAFKEVP